MRMSLTLRQTQKQQLKILQAHSYTSAGELELFSLHKIRNRLDTLHVSPKIRTLFFKELLEQNKLYQTLNERNWYCLTPDGVDKAIDNIDADLNNLAITISELQVTYEKQQLARTSLHKQKDKYISSMKHWISEQYYNIVYDTEGKIPYPIILQMREKIAVWAMGNSFPLSEPIESIIESAAQSTNMSTKNLSYDEIWDALKAYTKEDYIKKI
ncbi:MAG: hypothetical protein ACP5N3_02705 [Candidatus Nanoarchaeia archaeon]